MHNLDANHGPSGMTEDSRAKFEAWEADFCKRTGWKHASAWDAWKAAERIAEAMDNGMVYVPRLPTEAMLYAGANCLLDSMDSGDSWIEEARKAYAAMIAAAPQGEKK